MDLATGTLQQDEAKAINANATTLDICPGWPGATGPGAAAYAPPTRLLYVPANLLCMDMEARSVQAAKPDWLVPEPFPLAGGVLATAGGLVFYGTLDGWLKALDASTGRPVWQHQLEFGVIGTPSMFQSADGRQFLAVLAGIGGIGRVAWRSIDVRDATAANGYANALSDLPPQTAPGGALYLFALPQ